MCFNGRPLVRQNIIKSNYLTKKSTNVSNRSQNKSAGLIEWNSP